MIITVQYLMQGYMLNAEYITLATEIGASVNIVEKNPVS
jgi:hypothetical protein